MSSPGLQELGADSITASLLEEGCDTTPAAILIAAAEIRGSPLPGVGVPVHETEAEKAPSSFDWDDDSVKLIVSRALKSFSGCTLKGWTPPKDSLGFYLEIRRLQAALLLWYKTARSPFSDPDSIMYANLRKGPAYAEYVSDLIKYSLKNKLSHGPNWENDGTKPVYERYFDDSSIFPSSGLLRFSWTPTKRDRDKLFEEATKVVRPIENFKTELRRVLKDFAPDRIDPVKAHNYNSWYTTTKVWNGTPDGKTSFVYEKRGNSGSLPDFTLDFRFYGKLVFKDPAQQRDAVIGNLETLNSIKLLDFELSQITKCIPGIPMDGDPMSGAVVKLLSGKDSFYLMADIEKAGITLNHDLILACEEVLVEKYPDANFNLLEGHRRATYSDATIKDKKIIRGTGLGMSNRLQALITYTLGRMWLKKTRLTGEIVTVNDDSVLRISVPDTDAMSIDFLKSWTDFQTSYGVTMSKNKNFASMTCQFCEELLGPEEDLRTLDARHALNLANACFDSSCIVEAKDRFGSLDPRTKDQYLMSHLALRNYFIPRYGIEFSPNELLESWPVEGGGWWPSPVSEESGANQFLRICEKTYEGLGAIMLSVYVATRDHSMEFRPWRKLKPIYPKRPFTRDDSELSYEENTKFLSSNKFPIDARYMRRMEQLGKSPLKEYYLSLIGPRQRAHWGCFTWYHLEKGQVSPGMALPDRYFRCRALKDDDLISTPQVQSKDLCGSWNLFLQNRGLIDTYDLREGDRDTSAGIGYLLSSMCGGCNKMQTPLDMETLINISAIHPYPILAIEDRNIMGQFVMDCPIPIRDTKWVMPLITHPQTYLGMWWDESDAVAGEAHRIYGAEVHSRMAYSYARTYGLSEERAVAFAAAVDPPPGEDGGIDEDGEPEFDDLPKEPFTWNPGKRARQDSPASDIPDVAEAPSGGFTEDEIAALNAAATPQSDEDQGEGSGSDAFEGYHLYDQPSSPTEEVDDFG